jgi:HD-like signal output (HDOD) protein
MIVKGKFDWYSPDKTMSAAAAGLFNKIGGLKELPHVPMSVMEIQENLQSPEVDVPTLSKKVRRDPILAASLLEIANNLKSARDPKDKRKIEGIEHAIMFVGKKAFSELVMTISLQSFSAKTTQFNSDRFWKESFIVAELAELVCAKWGGPVIKDEVFISAALCNIGKIVGAIALPENTDRIEAMVNNPKTLCTWPQAEAILKVPNHALLGEIGGAMWGLPKYVLDAVASHHGAFPGLPKGQSRLEDKLLLAECVALANQLSHWILLRPSRIDQKTVDNICATAKISAKDLENFAEQHSGLSKRAA